MKWCPLHEQSGHDISECKLVLAQVDKMKAAWKGQNSEAKKSAKRSQQKQDLHAMIAELVSEKIKSHKEKEDSSSDEEQFNFETAQKSSKNSKSVSFDVYINDSLAISHLRKPLI